MLTFSELALKMKKKCRYSWIQQIQIQSKPLDPWPHWVRVRVVLTAEILAFLSRGQANNVCFQIFMAHARWLLFLKENTDFSYTVLTCMCSLIPGASQLAMQILSSNAMNCREWVKRCIRKAEKEKYLQICFLFIAMRRNAGALAPTGMQVWTSRT